MNKYFVAFVIVILYLQRVRPKTKSIYYYVGKWLINNFSVIRLHFLKKINIESLKFQGQTLKSWKIFGQPYVSIPNEPISEKVAFDLIERYDSIVRNILGGRHYSGMIYKAEELKSKSDNVLSYAFEVSNLWNGLHNEYNICDFINFQVVQMVANLFSAKQMLNPDISGFVVEGGSIGIMLMARIYKNAKDVINPIILATELVHASLFKAGETYDIDIVLVNEITESVIKKYKSRLICIICSTPSYAQGKVDDVLEISRLANKYKIPLHVDACLGGFVINELYETNYIDLKGVTSIGCCTHKNGLVSKGSSVLIMRNEYIKHAYYTYPKWSGGIYATPRELGSTSCVNSFITFLTMLCVGRNEYKRIAFGIQNYVKQMKSIITKHGLDLIENKDINVVAIKCSYSLADRLTKKGFIFSCVKDNIIQYCVTSKTLSYSDFIEKFDIALTASLLADHDNKDDKGENSRLYGSMDVALYPKIRSQGVSKYLENLLFGEIGAEHIIVEYLFNKMNPFNVVIE